MKHLAVAALILLSSLPSITAARVRLRAPGTHQTRPDTALPLVQRSLGIKAMLAGPQAIHMIHGDPLDSRQSLDAHVLTPHDLTQCPGWVLIRGCITYPMLILRPSSRPSASGELAGGERRAERERKRERERERKIGGERTTLGAAERA